MPRFRPESTDMDPGSTPHTARGVRASRIDWRIDSPSAIRALAAAIALSGFVAPSAHAQAGSAANGGWLDGKVTDSVHARPLGGVHVIAVGADSSPRMRGEATTDSSGKFHIDSLAPGRYMVGFESPLLDSLEIALPPRAVTVTAARSATVDLALPPAAKLRAALCPGVNLAEGTGVVYGHVVSAETEASMAGAVIALQWRELAVWDSTGGKAMRTVSSDRAASVTTDADGWYRACGLPTGRWVSMQIQHEGRVGPELRTLVEDTLGIAIRHLSFSASSARDSSAFADSAAVARLGGSATLTGVVRGTAGTPIPSAEVHVLGARSTALTDAEGSYTLSGLPAGTQALEVRRIGYGLAGAWVDLRNETTTRRDVRLERIVSLDSVRIVATRTRYKEFAEHQKFALGGRFLGPEKLQRMHFSRTSDIIRSLGGYVVENRGGRARVLSIRGASTRPCVVNVAIDGFSGWSDDPDAFSVDDVPPNLIGAMELYQGGGMPSSPEYDRGCGAIVIWTKR